MSDVQNSAETSGKKLGGVTGKGWLPGQSGNPGGRPKRKYLTDLIEELLEEKLAQGTDSREALKESLWQRLNSARVVGAMTLDKIWERTEGKVSQPVEVSGEIALTLSERMSKARERVKK